jgi:hypothetical protein
VKWQAKHDMLKMKKDMEEALAMAAQARATSARVGDANDPTSSLGGMLWEAPSQDAGEQPKARPAASQELFVTPLPLLCLRAC